MFLPQQHTYPSLKLKSSVFKCHLIPISCPQEAPNHIKLLRKTYYTAAHHCWAWRLLKPTEVALNWQENQSDDGEPRGSAGFPILHRLKHHEVVNTLAVVTREYGGIKLGKSGLISAYSDVIDLAISHSELIPQQACYLLNIENAYDKENLLKQWMHQWPLPLESSEYGMQVRRTFQVNWDEFEDVNAELKSWEHRSVRWQWSNLAVRPSI
tara:strand:+ start:1218 stop:1850 length:633 start_codon:yes stop_codon:yes gene_type:complete